MADIPEKEPKEFYQGDTVKWKRTDLPDYPATLWTLKYFFRGPSTKDITATADGDNYSITIAAVDSEKWSEGDYWWQAYGEKGTGQNIERYAVGEGRLQVIQKFAMVYDEYDGRSHVKKVLDAIELAIEGRASRTDLEYEIAGRRIQHMGPEELIKWHSHYKYLYDQEKSAEKIKEGLGTGNKVLVRFI